MGSHEIVGELFHDHEIVRNVKYSSLWVKFSHRYLDCDCINFNTFLYTWLVTDPSEHHYTVQTSNFKRFKYRASTMLKQNVFKATV